MKTLLIGDVGSTTAKWACISSDREGTFETIGFNPLQHDPALLNQMLASVLQHSPDLISEIHYYGTGIASDAARKLVTQGFQDHFKDADVKCESDILGAARALSPGKEGVVCILGTGSNSCLFDGRRIVKQIPSLGFPLGDEGSGADIGKACVRGFYYGLMPQEVRETFAQVLPENRSAFLQQFREHKTANKFLAELVPHVALHLNSEYIQSMLLDRFRTFARLHITPYDASCPVHFTGSVAYVFRDLLMHTLREENLIHGIISKSPLTGLIEFHKNTQA